MRLRFTYRESEAELAAAARRASRDPESGVALRMVEMGGQGPHVRVRERVVRRKTGKPVPTKALRGALAPYLEPDPGARWCADPWLPPLEVTAAPPKPRPMILDGLGLPLRG